MAKEIPVATLRKHLIEDGVGPQYIVGLTKTQLWDLMHTWCTRYHHCAKFDCPKCITAGVNRGMATYSSCPECYVDIRIWQNGEIETCSGYDSDRDEETDELQANCKTCLAAGYRR